MAGDLITYIKAGYIEIAPIIKEINPNINDFKRLLVIHYILTPEVSDFILRLPNMLRNLKTSTSKRETNLYGEIKGQIDWSKTIAMRLNNNYIDEMIFSCTEIKKEYSIKENLVLKELIETLYNVFFNELNIKEWSKYEWFSQTLKMSEIIKYVREKNIYLSKIKYVTEVTDRTIESIMKSRNVLYNKAAHLLKTYRKIINLDLGKDELLKLFCETVIHAKEDSTIFELYFIVKIINANAVNGRMHIIEEGNNLICSWHDDKYTYEIYHNVQGIDRHKIEFKVPTDVVKIEEYSKSPHIKRIIDLIEMQKIYIKELSGTNKNNNIFAGRPDFTLYITENFTNRLSKIIIGEAKYTSQKDTMNEGIEELVSYMSWGNQIIDNGERIYLDKTDIKLQGILLVDHVKPANDHFQNVNIINMQDFNEELLRIKLD